MKKEESKEAVAAKPLRTLVVGSIRGAYKPLLKALIAAEYNFKEDKLIVLGDMVDSGHDSVEVIEFLIKMQEFSVHKNVHIMGNRDNWCRNWLVKNQAPSTWTKQGGKATIDSYVRNGMVADKAHIKFFKNLVHYYIDENDRGYVHGGHLSHKGLGHEKTHSDYFWDRTLWARALRATKATKISPHKELFVGHTTTMNLTFTPTLRETTAQNMYERVNIPLNRANLWNLDTGAGFRGGKVTVMDVETKKYWQSNEIYVKSK